jgi:hypothetical protein
MIWTKDRLGSIIESLEKGVPVDAGQTLMLQALDIVIAGRQLVQEAIKRDEDADAKLAQRIER